eukprot:NODE_559_length_6687_cov_0.130237.p2 type:complete len:410 gc:universal NODE_559_length_6687_cov_0.130237:3097-1868(-)
MFTFLFFMYLMPIYSEYTMPSETRHNVVHEGNLGTGKFGSVEKVSVENEAESFALKTVISHTENGNCILSRGMQNEIKLLSHLDHPNIVKSKSFWTEIVIGPNNECNVKLLLELCDYDMLSFAELWQDAQVPKNGFDSMIIEDSSPDVPPKIDSLLFSSVSNSPSNIIYHTATGVLSALVYMHDKGVYHMDIKPDNMALKNHPSASDNPSFIIKLIDFNSSSDNAERVIENGGSMLFLPRSVSFYFIEYILLKKLFKLLRIPRKQRPYHSTDEINKFIKDYKHEINIISDAWRRINDVNDHLHSIPTFNRIGDTIDEIKSRIEELEVKKFNSRLLDLYALGKSLIEITGILYSKEGFKFTGHESEQTLLDILDELPCDSDYKRLIKSMMSMDEKLSAKGQLELWTSLRK